jgi:hypothetical protein
MAATTNTSTGVSVDEHAKLKTKLSSQPRATSPTCVSRVTWGPTQVSWIPDESQKVSHKVSHKDKVRGIPQGPRDPTNKVRGIPQTYRL